MYLLAGISVGVLYAGLNTVFDRWDRSHRVFAGMLTLHVLVDQVLPIVTGALLGVALFLWQSRSRAAHREAIRAEELATRLRSVEREQAVWVVATAALHDVRNPLHSLGLLLDELAEVPEGDAERTGLVDRARVQVHRIRTSIGSMRQLADAAQPEPVAFGLAAVVREVVDAHEARARGQSVTVSTRFEDVQVRADPMHVRIVVDALFTNALDALRGRGGKVDLELRDASEGAILRISDDGSGIDRELRARVFQPLATTKPAGLGLGLSIARALTRAMQGELEIVDREGFATTFQVRLPQAREEE
jgi:two-component system sensor histidine kinase PilS (NtrC family)